MRECENACFSCLCPTVVRWLSLAGCRWLAVDVQVRMGGEKRGIEMSGGQAGMKWVDIRWPVERRQGVRDVGIDVVEAGGMVCWLDRGDSSEEEAMAVPRARER